MDDGRTAARADGANASVTVAAPPPRVGRRIRLWWLLVPASALVVTWVWLGLSPAIAPGSLVWGSSGLVEETDDSAGAGGWPASTTYVAVDPAPGEAWVVHSFRNDGRLTLTVSAPAPSLASTSTLLAIDHRLQLGEVPADRLTVAPGEEFALRTVVDWPPCASWTPGASMGPTAVALDVTTLGLTQTMTLPLEPGIMIRTTGALDSPCD